MEPTHRKIRKLDRERRKVSQYCLGLPTVLRQILEHFSTKELMELSLVNKLWNFEARSIMKERGNLSALIWHGKYEDEDQCQRLPEFVSDIESMPVIPFSGIHFVITHKYECPSISNGPALDPSHKAILNRIPLKRFKITFYDDKERYKNCRALALLKQTLEDYCELLEDLTLEFGNEQFLRPIFQEDRVLPRLKYLRFDTMPYASGNNSFTSTFVKTLVSRAPNLQQLRVCPIDLTVNVLVGSSAVLVPNFTFRALTEPICQELIGSIRAEKIQIRIDRVDIQPGLLNGFIPLLLKNSRNTLKTMSMDLFFAAPLMCYELCLENVTHLGIHINCYSLEDIEPSILALARGFDFTRVFPKLNKVSIHDDYNDRLEFSFNFVSGFIEQANAALNRASPERAIDIEQLDIILFSPMKDSTLELLARMFPDVKTVRTRKQLKGVTFTDLREHFLCLEEVTYGII